MKRGVAGSLIVLSCAQGCSWLSVTAPPPEHAQTRYFDCTTEDYAPGIDVYLAAGYAIGAAIIAVSVLDDGSELEAPMGVALGAQGIGAALHGASAMHGYAATRACRDARSAAAARTHNDLVDAIKGGHDESVAMNAGDELELKGVAASVPRVAMARNRDGQEEVRLDMSVGERRFLIKMVPATDALVTFGYQIPAPSDGATCELRIAADGLAVVVAEQATSTRDSKQNVWGKLDLDRMATLGKARRIVVRACDVQADLGSAEIAAIDAFVLRARESIALQSAPRQPEAPAVAPAPTPATTP